MHVARKKKRLITNKNAETSRVYNIVTAVSGTNKRGSKQNYSSSNSFFAFAFDHWAFDVLPVQSHIIKISYIVKYHWLRQRSLFDSVAMWLPPSLMYPFPYFSLCWDCTVQDIPFRFVRCCCCLVVFPITLVAFSSRSNVMCSPDTSLTYRL